jgi:MFS superfamily sulfate permease-like transporter
MTENESSGIIDLNSKFWRTTLLLLAVVLIFAGPTYVPLEMTDLLKINYVASILTGLVLLIVGLLLLGFLVRKKIIL